MKLYYAPRTRATRPRWLLEELSVPYELVRLDLSKREHKTAEYLKIHPHGAVPAFVDGDLTLIESAAICMYLADKYPEKGFAPALGTPERGIYYQWVLYSMVTVDPVIASFFVNKIFYPEEKRSLAALEEAQKDFIEIARVLSPAIAGKEFLVGDRFTVADLLMGSLLGWAASIGLSLSEFPDLKQYSKNLGARPACRRAVAD
jgi:glutathione S-transferase